MYELEECIPLFLKFTTDEVADILVSGSFRLRNLKYYREYEDEKCKGIGDRHDGSAVLNNVVLSTTNTISGEVIETPLSKVSTHDENLIRLPVFCLYRVDNRMLKYSEVKGDYVSFRPYLEDEEIQKIREEFGDTVVIISPGTFKEKLEKYCNENGIGMISDNVKYLDFNVNSKETLELFVDPSNPKVCFRKDICFSHQREYRFLLDKPKLVEYMDIKLEGLTGTISKLPLEKFFSGDLEIRFPLIEKSELR